MSLPRFYLPGNPGDQGVEAEAFHLPGTVIYGEKSKA